MSTVEAYTPNGTAGNSAPVVGGRKSRRRSHKLRKVSAKTIRAAVRKLGIKPKSRVVLKGGEDCGGVGQPPCAPAPAMGGKRKSRRARKSALGKLFGM